MVQRLQLYVFRQCIQSILLTLFVILAAIMLVDVVEQFRTVGNDTDINAIQAVQLSAMKLPLLLEQSMPFIILVSAMLAFSRLSRLTY